MLCFKFPDRETFMALAQAEGLVATDDDGNETLITASHTHSLDEVGVISKGGEWDPETGEVITPPTVLDGWHVNLMAADAPEAWDPYLCIVNHPVRVFAGGPTQAPATDVLEEIVQ
jgi:hypothetical protein